MNISFYFTRDVQLVTIKSDSTQVSKKIRLRAGPRTPVCYFSRQTVQLFARFTKIWPQLKLSFKIVQLRVEYRVNSSMRAQFNCVHKGVESYYMNYQAKNKGWRHNLYT